MPGVDVVAITAAVMTKVTCSAVDAAS